MLRSIIIDDEKRSRDTLLELLRMHCPDVEVVDTADSARTGAEVIRRHRPDLIFLDVSMPRASGFDLLEDITDVPCEVIFTTAYGEHAIRAIRAGAIDYLLKPIAEDDLIAAVARVMKRRAAAEAAYGTDAALDVGSTSEESGRPRAAPPERLALPMLEGLIFVQVRDIVRCQSSDNYTIFHMNSGERVVVARTLKEYEETLGAYEFFRVHNSHLVNLAYVRKYVKGDGGYIVMSDNSEIEVSRRRKEDLLRRLSSM